MDGWEGDMKKRKESGTVRIMKDLDRIERNIEEYGLSEVARDMGFAPKDFWVYLDAARRCRAEGRVPKVGRPTKSATPVRQAPVLAPAPAPVATPTLESWEAEEYGSLPTSTPTTARHPFVPTWSSSNRFIEDEPNM
jgi:hypothetical protein